MRYRPTVAIVDLDAIRENVRALRPAAAGLMAVVKANAYGHGAVPVARVALEAGAAWLGVALVEEGVALREAGIEAPILVLTEFPPGSEKEALAGELTPTLYTEAGLHALAEAARHLGRTARAHVKLDTGMHRVGLPVAEAETFCAAVLDAGVQIEGVWTHFAKADEPEDGSAHRQLTTYLEALERLRAAGIEPTIRHAANSAATLAFPASHLDLVRVGIAMYGLDPSPEVRANLRPAMSLRSRVGLTKRVAAGEALSYGLRYRLDRESTIATIPVGYADGYARGLSTAGRVAINGKRYPVAGTVTMDQLLVDCGDDPVTPGDEVVLFGEDPTADEVGAWYGTIGYEVVCAVSERVPREYRGAA